MSLPTKEDVFEARAAVGHTQVAAAAVISVSIRSWQDWEGGIRPMPSNLYRLYRHLVGIEAIPFTKHPARNS
jgi:DNA-binding transcriptional regulator YiaG